MSHSIETCQLNAFLDGELCPIDCLEVEQALKQDVALRKKYEQMKTLKNNIRNVYQSIPEPALKPEHIVSKPKWLLPSALAASMFLGLILGVSFLKAFESERFSAIGVNQELSSNYLIHIDSDDTEKQAQAIKEIEQLLKTAQAGIKVDVISNYKGVSLFDVNNQNNPELTRLLNTYDNLTLFACKRALERAKMDGQAVQLMPQVHHEKPAIDAVVERLNSGWRYKKI